MPSDLVESVEINKTLHANMDGDAIGGSVNLRTKTAGEQPTISLFGIGGHTPILDGRGVTQFGGTIGQRFGKDKKLGILFGGTYDWNGRGINDLEPAPSVIQCDPGNCLTPSDNAPFVGTYPTEDIREYRYYRARWGFEGSADYKLNDNSQIYVRGLYSHFDNFGDRWVYTPTINSFTTSPFARRNGWKHVGGCADSPSHTGDRKLCRRRTSRLGDVVADVGIVRFASCHRGPGLFVRRFRSGGWSFTAQQCSVWRRSE